MNRLRWAAFVLVAVLIPLPDWTAAQATPVAGPLQFFETVAQPLSVSQNGTKIAVHDPHTSLCVFALPTQQQVACASLEEQPIYPLAADVVWSPDSSRLAFTEMGYITGDDSDLWVMDAQTGQLTNLTDDGYIGSLLSLGDDAGASFSVDSSPAWTPDGQSISFARSDIVDGERGGTALFAIPASGGSPELLATVSETEMGAVFYRSAWSADDAALYFTYNTPNPDDLNTGVWKYDPQTGQLTQLIAADERLGAPILLQASPAGDSLLIWYPAVLQGSDMADPLIRLIDATTGEILPLELPPPDQATLPARIVATFSPDGAGLLFLLVPVGNVGQLWTADLSTGTYARVVEGIDDTLLDPQFPPSWAANDLLAVPTASGAVALTTISGFGTDASTPVSLREQITTQIPGWDRAAG
jgi:hypothetical protein